MSVPFGVPSPSGGPAPTTPSQAPAPTTPPASVAPPATTPAGGPQIPTIPEGQGQSPRPDDHVIRSVLQQQEQTLRQKWEQENAERLELERIVREQGHDPKTLIQQYKEAKQQEEMARRAQGMGMGQVNPEFLRYLSGLENQIAEMKQTETRREGLRLLQEGENRNVELAKTIGIADYGTVKDQVRQFALQNGYDIEAAFKIMHFDQLTKASQQAGSAEALLAMQGRGQGVQPHSAGVPSTPGGPVDYSNMPREQFVELQRRLRAGG